MTRLRFMLDTNTVSFALRGQGDVANRIVKYSPSELCMSSITAAELQYGAARRGSARLSRLIEAFTRGVAVVPFDEAGASAFGKIAWDLAQRGASVGEMDTLIASHAVSLGLTLVTNNVKHFGRVRGLTLEDWL